MRKVAIALLAPLLLGCASVSTGLPERKKVSEQQLVDVPVPELFRFDAKESFVHQTSFRSAHLFYVGPGWLGEEEVANFYSRYMQSQEWVLVRKKQGRNSGLVFTKGDEVCTVFAHTRKGRTATHLEIEVRPRA